MATQYQLHHTSFRYMLSMRHQLNRLAICAKPSVAQYPPNTQAKHSLQSFGLTLALNQFQLSKHKTLAVLKVKLQYIRTASYAGYWFCWVGKMGLIAHHCNGGQTNPTCLNQPVTNDKVADGLLVRDLDSNGLIDTGRELFGSETLLNNGNKAANDEWSQVA